jgi:ubiquinone/menaquinone biosynthesis C-methylase UbiE
MAESASQQDVYFEMLAEMDLTKHLGSLVATQALADLCKIDRNSYVLDVGSGVGFTPCYLARHYGCRVVGIDLYESMVKRATERARREGLADLVEFRTADMQDLPFEDALFDAVVAESVIAFAPDKPRTLEECVRVLKPGGYVGFTEATWVKDPTPDLLEQPARVFGTNFETFTVDGWRRLVEGAGLEDVVAEMRKVDVRDEARGRVKRIGCRNMMRSLTNFVAMIFRRPAYRGLMREALREPKELLVSWGYGIYAGRKPG